MLEIKNAFNIEYIEFPTGRRTRIMIGENGAIKGSHFCQGLVEIFEGGRIPEHNHETVESYTIIEGSGTITIDGESTVLNKGDYVFIESRKKHSLVNTGRGPLYMMFVYAPQIIVDHWAEEIKEGKK